MISLALLKMFTLYVISFLFQQILRNQIDAEREQYQPTPMEKILAMIKSLFLRGMVIYFIMSVFRRQPTPANNNSAG